jgi:hypothetical protein
MTLHDWIELAPVLIGITGAVWGWMQRRWRMPKRVVWALTELKRAGITEQVIDGWLLAAAALTDTNREGKRDYVKQKLSGWAQANGFELSDSTANTITEYALGKLKERVK